MLSPAAKEFKTIVVAQVGRQATNKQLALLANTKWLEVFITMYSSTWLTKTKTVRRKDISSYEKILSDAVFEGLKIDDSKIFKIHLSKSLITKDEQEKIVYEIWGTDEPLQ